MHSLISEALDQYCAAHSSPEPEWLYTLNRQTHLQTELPIMLSGHLQGRVLSMISHLMRPNLILEIGTFTGYSALCLAEGLAPGGTLITLDIQPETMEIAREHIAASPYADRITCLTTDAAAWLREDDRAPDLVFIDADKINYSLYFDLLIDRLKPGALILADNVLFQGQVLKGEAGGKNARAMHAYNQKISADPRLENVLLPIRDGIMLSRKK